MAKRLGLSATVAAQIARYRTLGYDEIPRDEAVSVFRLVGRRSDAPLVYADAGRRAARYAAKRVATHALGRLAPDAVGRLLSARAARAAVRETLDADLRFPDSVAVVHMKEPLSVLAWPAGEACGFYASAFGELLRVLIGFEGSMRHDACRGRGDAECVWRAAPGGAYD